MPDAVDRDSIEMDIMKAHVGLDELEQGVTDGLGMATLAKYFMAYHRLLDRLVALVRLEQAERMHVPGCGCHQLLPPDTSYLNCDGPCKSGDAHPYIDPRCKAERDRLRAEAARLAGKEGA